MIGRCDSLREALSSDTWPDFKFSHIDEDPNDSQVFSGSTRYVNYCDASGDIELPELYKTKDECCGCSACATRCPSDAIFMFPDTEGFLYPAIDAAKCIGCGICLKVCPLN